MEVLKIEGLDIKSNSGIETNATTQGEFAVHIFLGNKWGKKL